jgi:Zn-dependent protease with chaperone function
MTFEIRVLLVALAAYAVINLATSALVALAWTRWAQGEAASRARRLALLRALPTATSLLGVVWGTASFLRFEPRGHDETFGVVFVALACVPIGLLAVSLWRGVRSARQARRVGRLWLDRAEPVSVGVSLPAFAIRSGFPVVAVVGLFRPRLIVARSVLAACTPEELEAIFAHERAHVRRGDNWMRFALTVLPDALGLLPASSRLLAGWHAAAEDAADDGARALGPAGRLTLAQALIRVARMAPADGASGPLDPAMLPATALFRGGDVARRVRRLLDPPRPPRPPRPTAASSRVVTRVVAGLGSAVACALGVLLMEPLHDVVETIVTLLP